MLLELHPRRILNVATGTADLAIETARLNPEQVIGVDISTKMLEIARAKIIKKNLEDIIAVESGEAEHLRFESGSFDVVMTAFGVQILRISTMGCVNSTECFAAVEQQ